MATNLATEIAINAHKYISTRYNKNVITYNRTNPKKTISDCKGLRDVAIATKFWPESVQNHKNGHNFSCIQHIYAEFGFEIGFVPLGTSSVTLLYRRKAALP